MPDETKAAAAGSSARGQFDEKVTVDVCDAPLNGGSVGNLVNFLGSQVPHTDDASPIGCSNGATTMDPCGVCSPGAPSPLPPPV